MHKSRTAAAVEQLEFDENPEEAPHMSEERENGWLDWVHQRMVEWGRYRRDPPIYSTLPSETPEYRLWRQGAGAAHQMHREHDWSMLDRSLRMTREIREFNRAREINDIVFHWMPKPMRDLALVTYIDVKGSGSVKPIRLAAQDLRMTVMVYRQNKTAMLGYVYGQIDAMVAKRIAVQS